MFDALASGAVLVDGLLAADRRAAEGRTEYDDAYYDAFFAAARPVLERRTSEAITAVAGIILGAWEQAGQAGPHDAAAAPGAEDPRARRPLGPRRRLDGHLPRSRRATPLRAVLRGRGPPPGPDGDARPGWRAALSRQFHRSLAYLEAERRGRLAKAAAAERRTRLQRLRDRALGWLAERVAEQRLLVVPQERAGRHGAPSRRHAGRRRRAVGAQRTAPRQPASPGLDDRRRAASTWRRCRSRRFPGRTCCRSTSRSGRSGICSRGSARATVSGTSPGQYAASGAADRAAAPAGHERRPTRPRSRATSPRA